MTNEYASLVKAMKALTQVVDPEAEVQKTVTLPVAEDEWRTRPDTVSYGMISYGEKRSGMDSADHRNADGTLRKLLGTEQPSV